MSPGRVALIVAMFVGGIACHRDTPQSQASTSQDVRELVFAVEGMHCDTCPLTVRTAARAVTGVVAVNVTTEPGRAVVSYRPAVVTPQTIAAAITESGYPAHEMPRSPGP